MSELWQADLTDMSPLWLYARDPLIVLQYGNVFYELHCEIDMLLDRLV